MGRGFYQSLQEWSKAERETLTHTSRMQPLLHQTHAGQSTSVHMHTHPIHTPHRHSQRQINPPPLYRQPHKDKISPCTCSNTSHPHTYRQTNPEPLYVHTCMRTHTHTALYGQRHSHNNSHPLSCRATPAHRHAPAPFSHTHTFIIPTQSHSHMD